MAESKSKRQARCGRVWRSRSSNVLGGDTAQNKKAAQTGGFLKTS
jgi:hypothetical protein